MTWTVYWTLNLCCLPVLIASALLFDYPVCLPPALILSLNSDFDSALSTLLLKPVIDPCLFDVNSVLIKLHMDSQDNASPLHLPVYASQRKPLWPSKKMSPTKGTTLATLDSVEKTDWFRNGRFRDEPR